MEFVLGEGLVGVLDEGLLEVGESGVQPNSGEDSEGYWWRLVLDQAYHMPARRTPNFETWLSCEVSP